MIWRLLLPTFALLVLTASCAPGQSQAEQTSSAPSEVQGGGYKITKQPIDGPVVPVIPDPTDQKSQGQPKQSSYDTPYQPDGSKRPIGKDEMKAIEPAPVPPGSRAKPISTK